ncbi:MAG: glycosyltransferase family 4 protein [Chitinophagaceae bacterium]
MTRLLLRYKNFNGGNQPVPMDKRRILITSPSLNVAENVSGISSLVADIINFSKNKFVHLQLGSKDKTKQKNLRWAFNQLSVLSHILYTTVFKRYDIVHLNVGLEKPSIIRDSMVFFIVKGLFGKKVILHIHGGYFLMNEAKSKLIAYLLKKIFTKAEAIVVLSDLEKQVLEKRYGNLSFHAFPNAVDTSSMNGLSKRRVSDKLRFIFMGRIHTSKGIYTISESLQYLSKYFDRFTLNIYGAGFELEEWIASLETHKGLQYTYYGVVGGKDKWDALNNSDVFLLPSLHSEGMPIAMIEAMAAGCVVIVTDVASIKSVIDNNFNGILLSESSPEQLAKKMEEIILGKYNLKFIGNNARQYVKDNLSIPTYIGKLDELYLGM